MPERLIHGALAKYDMSESNRRERNCFVKRWNIAATLCHEYDTHAESGNSAICLRFVVRQGDPRSSRMTTSTARGHNASLETQSREELAAWEQANCDARRKHGRTSRRAFDRAKGISRLTAVRFTGSSCCCFQRAIQNSAPATPAHRPVLGEFGRQIARTEGVKPTSPDSSISNTTTRSQREHAPPISARTTCIPPASTPITSLISMRSRSSQGNDPVQLATREGESECR